MQDRTHRCQAADWCDQTGEHTEHEGVLGTWLGLSAKGENRLMTVQAVVHSNGVALPRLAIVLVDSLLPTRPLAADLSWQQVGQAGWALVDAASRWRD